jgi:hypothetical protein
MGRAVAVRTDYTVAQVRRLAKRAKDAPQARRLRNQAIVEPTNDLGLRLQWTQQYTGHHWGSISFAVRSGKL